MENKVQLITYVDRLGGHTLRELHDLLAGPLKDVFGAVQILPFFVPIDGADAGFDPVDHTQVDPKVGSWDDVRLLAKDIDVMADVIVNHISADSAQFRDYLARDSASPHDGLFLGADDVFPSGPSKGELSAIYRPRPGVPFTKLRLQSGEERTFWTTFTPQQIDINVERPPGQSYLSAILRRFHAAGIKMIRLDAVGYAIKRAGTSCFMLPETFAFIDRLSAHAKELGMEVLVEVHSYYRQQIEVARHADWVYDFALPPLLLHAFAFHTAHYLAEWIRIRPKNAMTVLDTHDGIGVIDIGADATDRGNRPGLVPAAELAELVGIIHERTNGESGRATGAAASNLDLYQVNATFFDAMGRDDERYLLARAVQFFLPGVPQVYYVGLLCGSNDMELLARTGVGRDINRHYYTRDEVEARLKDPVVKRLLDLIRVRNTHPAFQGEFHAETVSDSILALSWANAPAWAHLTVDFKLGSGVLRYSDGGRSVEISFSSRLDDDAATRLRRNASGH